MINNEEWEKVYNTRVTPTTKLEESRVLLEYNGCEIFAEGTLSVISGQAKSRKTFAMSLLIEQMLTPCVAGFASAVDDGTEVLWLDTEQAERRVQLVSKRFSRSNQLTFLPIRQYNILQRYNIIEEAIKRLRPNIVVIDGYKELTNDINDQGYSTRLTNKLLEWSTIYNCHITGVLHLNPGSTKLRGALGTELLNKCSSVMNVEARGHKSSIESTYSRDKNFESMVFTINSDGVPTIEDRYAY